MDTEPPSIMLLWLILVAAAVGITVWALASFSTWPVQQPASTRVLPRPATGVNNFTGVSVSHLPNFADLAKKVIPGAVSISVATPIPAPKGVQVGDAPINGAGFFVDSGHYMVTNAHVVAGKKQVYVHWRPSAGAKTRTFVARVIGASQRVDVAVLKAETGKVFPSVSEATVGSEKLGQWVMTVGAPYGYAGTVTQGIITHVGRHLDIPGYRHAAMLQTDLPDGPGCSGGPIFNLKGQVIGMNSQDLVTNQGKVTGLSFALPIGAVMQAAHYIIKRSHQTRK